MMVRKLNLVLLLIPLVFTSLTGCIVSKKKFVAAEATIAELRTDSTSLAKRVSELETTVATMTQSNTSLQQNVDKLKQQLDVTSRDAAGKIASQQSLLNKNREELATQQQKLETLQNLLEQQK